MNVDIPQEFTCLSLCSGYAGLELGLRRVVPNLRTVCYVEIELFAVANLVAKMEAGLLDAAPIWTDIKTFPADGFRGKVDIIVGGYPCQPFSVAGKRAGESDPRHLWPDIERIVRTVDPLWCFFENVPGHLTLGFPSVYRSLRDMGYAVEAGLFTAAECGAPHKRERLFILAHRESGGRRELWGPHREKGCELVEGGGELADTASVYTEGKRQLRDHVSRPMRPTLSDSQCPESWPGNGQEPPTGQRRDRPSECGTTMAHPATQRVQGPIPAGPAQTRGPADEYGDCDRWPAPPGQPQYEWEEPRTVGNAPCHNEQRDALPGTHGQGKPIGGSSGPMEYPASGGTRAVQQPGQRASPESPSPVVDPARLHGPGTGRHLRRRRGVCQTGEPMGITASDDERRIGQSAMHGQGIETGGSSGQTKTEVEPGMGGATHGTPCRVDRLRLLGNGVVPAQAEKAWRVLLQRFRTASGRAGR